MLKMPKILIFLAILALGASHPLISGGVIRSHKSMPKWRPFQTAGEDPRILPLAAAIMNENSAAPHPPILHGNGPDSPSPPPANLEDLDQFVSGIKSSLRDQISSLLALDSGPYMAYGNRGWPIHHNFGQKRRFIPSQLIGRRRK